MKQRKIFFYLIFLITTGFFFLEKPVLYSQKQQGEILLPGPSKEKMIKEVETTKSKKIENGKKKTQKQEENRDEKQYKRKIYITYLVFFLTSIYLLITYRKKRRRI